MQGERRRRRGELFRHRKQRRHADASGEQHDAGQPSDLVERHGPAGRRTGGNEVILGDYEAKILLAGSFRWFRIVDPFILAARLLDL